RARSRGRRRRAGGACAAKRLGGRGPVPGGRARLGGSAAPRGRAGGVGALPDLVRDGEAGILVPPDDPPAWARATARLEDDAECRRLGEGARAIWSQRHSPEQGLRGLEAAYERARSVAPGNLGGAGE